MANTKGTAETTVGEWRGRGPLHPVRKAVSLSKT